MQETSGSATLNQEHQTPDQSETHSNLIQTLDLNLLNKEQKEAVVWPKGAIQIFAGAGSGKTRVITYRIAHLIQNGVFPSQILAVTFTNKAAKELQERIGRLLQENTHGMWVGTFHSIAVRILRMYGAHIHIDSNFVIYDQNDQVALIKEILKDKNIDEKSFQPKSLLYAISEAKEKFIGPEKFNASANGFFESVVAKVYTSYNERLLLNNALDFDDLLFHTVTLLENCEEARQYYQQKIHHVLVDEYQDINNVQYKMIALLSGHHKNITIVGDDDQSIYAWRGANLNLMYKFAKDYPNTKIIKLTQNYRSTQNILEAAHNVIEKNTTREDKKLWTTNPTGDKIHIIEAGSEYDEAHIIANKILNLVQSGQRKFGDIAILYRTNAQSRVLEETLLNLRIPHILIGGQRFYERKEIKDIIAYLRILMNSYDSISIKRIINTPARGIGATTVSNLDKCSYEKECTLWDVLSSPISLNELFTKRTSTLLEDFVKFIHKAKEYSQGHTISETVRYILDKTGYIENLRSDKSSESQSRIENLEEFINVTTTYENSTDSPSLIGFLEGVSLVADVDNLNENGDAVTLMTLHASKGLEFPIIFLSGMEESIFPHSRSLNDETQLAEERRLCYVGMTRAKEMLHLLYANSRSMYGQPIYNQPSRFLEDIPDNLTLKNELRRTSSYQGSYHSSRQNAHPSRYSKNSNSFQHQTFSSTQKTEHEATENHSSHQISTLFTSGEQVKHVKFGIGVVLQCSKLGENDHQVTVAFPGVIGIKKMVQSIAKLEKSVSP